jgi:enoyl-CoA hydratase
VIRVERREHGIVWVIFDRPQARNAMTFAMWDQLRDLARDLDADPAVKVVVFTGSEAGAFIAGTDINEFRAFTGADDGSAYEARIESVIRALEAIRVPTIAAISGACTGGGVSVAGQCDLRIGSPGARIGVPIARTLGNCISLTNIARLGAIIGLDAVKTLIFTGRLLRAEEALRVGFLTEIAESDEELPERAQEVAEALLELAPLTLRATKETVRRIRDTQLPDDGDLVRMCYGSRDFREGLTAFLEKRRADWSGE